ncbi:MAG TPA: hypothetical protein H9857_09175, partial [Candidatus Desulfovibrio intestinigallinarum]|nr:hypothetical protein [Candidatus Desulfovibrio intestinigallinarum]
EMLRIPNHTACRFAEKARFFRSLWAGRRCAAASRFTFFKVETLQASLFRRKAPLPFPQRAFSKGIQAMRQEPFPVQGILFPSAALAFPSSVDKSSSAG